MDLREKLRELIVNSSTYIDVSGDPELAVSLVDADINNFLSVVEQVSDPLSKDIYVKYVDALIELHYDYNLLEILLTEIPDGNKEMEALMDELNALLNASDAPMVFTKEDRDYITVGQLIAMSVYYDGSPNDQNREGEPTELSEVSYSKVRTYSLMSKKQRLHLRTVRRWHLLK